MFCAFLKSYVSWKFLKLAQQNDCHLTVRRDKLRNGLLTFHFFLSFASFEQAKGLRFDECVSHVLKADRLTNFGELEVLALCVSNRTLQGALHGSAHDFATGAC